MNCPICWQAEPVGRLISINFERDEARYVINHIPARVCPDCGEAFVEEQVAEALLLQAKELSETGVLEGVVEYNIPS